MVFVLVMENRIELFYFQSIFMFENKKWKIKICLKMLENLGIKMRMIN